MRKVMMAVLIGALSVCAVAADIPPAKKALIHELLQATHASDRASDVILHLFGAKASPEVQEKIRRDPGTAQIAEKAVFFLYDRYFTEKQLRDLVAFFKSDTGQRYVTVARELSQQSQQQIRFAVAEDLQSALEKSKAVRTRSDMRTLATATEAFGADNNKYPNARDVAGLEKQLVPTYILTFPRVDGWGHAFVYVKSPDGAHYIIASAGPDGKLETASTSFKPPKNPSAYGDDLVFIDGQFVRGGDDQRFP